ncbi:ABC transporter substrate-binding protein [Oleispirillum naphthae]|uniref:ABC transporter substrate-binding protein n=1 Tax=Oleispirillum naphthae TaxID=2838853 RepID=UPI00308243E9
MRRFAFLALAAGLLASGAAAAKPRVMSLDLCSDQLLLALAEPEQIVSVTATALRPSVSAYAERARALGVAVNHGAAEEAVRLAPEMIFAGRWSGRGADALRRMGLPVLRFPPPTSVDAVIGELRRAGQALEQPEAAERAVAAILAAQARMPDFADAPGVVLYLPGGYGYGGGTLVSDMLRLARMRNLLAEAGRSGFARIDLEHLVLMRPDLVLVGEAEGGPAPRLSAGLMRHPALRHAAEGAQRMVFPPALWVCGGAQTAAALDYLRTHRPAGN